MLMVMLMGGIFVVLVSMDMDVEIFIPGISGPGTAVGSSEGVEVEDGVGVVFGVAFDGVEMDGS